MTPTIGQIVHYQSYGTPNGEFKPRTRAAIVTAVISDTVVHLCVLNPTGMFFNTNVEQGTEGGTWNYQPTRRAITTITTDQEDIVLYHTSNRREDNE